MKIKLFESFSRKSFKDLIDEDDVITHLFDMIDKDMIIVDELNLHHYVDTERRSSHYKMFNYYTNLITSERQKRDNLNNNFLYFIVEFNQIKGMVKNVSFNRKGYCESLLKKRFEKLYDLYDIDIFVHCIYDNFIDEPMAGFEIIIQEK